MRAGEPRGGGIRVPGGRGSTAAGQCVGGGVAGLTALGYVLRITVGLPPVVPNPMSFARPTSGAVSTVVEVLVVLLAVLALSRTTARRPVAAPQRVA